MNLNNKIEEELANLKEKRRDAIKASHDEHLRACVLMDGIDAIERILASAEGQESAK